MTLGEIQNPLGMDLAFTGCQLSASDIEPGNLFIAVQGAKHHGIDFLDQARANGAVAVLTDSKNLPKNDFPYLLSDNPRAVAGRISAELYGTNESHMRLFGITGTNGKTSTATYIHQLLSALGVAAGLSASTGRLVGSTINKSDLTTPESTKLHWLLAQMRVQDQQTAVLEVSAQALIRNRVDGLHFETVGFTNLSRDHLDDFETMDNYLDAKARLFSKSFATKGVVMVDDEYGIRLAKIAPIPVVTLGQDAGQWRYLLEGEILSVSNPEGKKISCEFFSGALMAKNFALAAVMLAVSGFSLQQIEDAMPLSQKQVPGRLERVSDQLPAVFVDYAHTPSGVQGAVSQMLKDFPGVVVVLGASGNRDQGKRAAMALATQGSALLVITDQHPRNENPAEIRAALSAAALEGEINFIEIADPEEAISYAIGNCPVGSAVLWCGPGNLDYREIKGEHIAFDARKIARKLVEND
jgi:UDP-N-acetylmuramoyl-L-alanyl-D-glutamate--2,6-diaminopimelate ligase